MSYLYFVTRTKMKETMIELYTARMLRAMAYSLIGVFIPIYLLSLGFSFQQVISFLLVKYLVSLVSSPFIPLVQKKAGVKRTIFISTIFLSAFFLMLYSIQQYHWSIYLLAALQGLDLIFFWVPLNSEFVSNSSEEHVGKQIGILIAVPRVVSLLAPFLGALVIYFFNFDVLLIISLLIIVSSSFPLFLSKEDFFKVKKITKTLLTGTDIKLVLLYFVRGVTSAAMLLWPLFAYYSLKDYLFVGGVSTFRSFAGLLVTLFIGWLSDKTSTPRLIRMASVFSFLSWLLVLFLPSTPLIVALLSFVVGFSFITLAIPSFSFVCKKRIKGAELGMMTFREMIINLGRISVFSMLLFLPHSKAFSLAFTAAALGSLSLAFWFSRD